MARSRKSPKTLEAFKAKLLAEQDELREQIQELEGHQRADAASAIDEETREPETATYERERDFTLLVNARDLLDKVEHALTKFDDETYGQCERCEKTIETPRLKALPYATLCISCQRASERR